MASSVLTVQVLFECLISLTTVQGCQFLSRICSVHWLMHLCVFLNRSVIGARKFRFSHQLTFCTSSSWTLILPLWQLKLREDLYVTVRDAKISWQAVFRCGAEHSLFWDFTERMLVVLYRRFGTTCTSHLQGSSSPEIFPRSCP